MNLNIKNSDIGWHKKRVGKALILILAAFSALIIRLFYLQVIKGEKFEELSRNNRIRLRQIPPFRGLIYDSNGKLLVDNRPSFDISIIPKDAAPLNRTLENLARYINIPADPLIEKIRKKKGIASYKPIVLKTDIDRDMLAAIEVNKFNLPGVVLSVSLKRDYIYEDCAAHFIGYLGEIGGAKLKDKKYSDFRPGDFIGKFGVEKKYENFLRGKRGGRQIEVNAKGQMIKVLNTVDAKLGSSLYLTIDLPLQLKAEELLKDKAGAIVAIDPNTGEILAIASSPAFNQNDFVKSMSHNKWRSLIQNKLKPMLNKAIQGEYPPGSVYKIITAAAALEEGIINPKTKFRCSGKLKYGNRTYRCWKKKGHGYINVEDAIAESCDVFFYEVGQRLGVDKLAKYAKAFGLGIPTGIELDNENSGLVPTSAWKKRKIGRNWQSGETLSVSIGQSYNLATPIQVAVLIASIANGGIKCKPIIVKKVFTADGTVIKYNVPEKTGRLPISDRTLEIIKNGLFKVVNSGRGTARLIFSSKIAISGKTGTSQVASSKEEDADKIKKYHLRPHAWFAAYAPSDNPEIAISVFIEHGEHGSRAAAPLAKEMIKEYLSKKTKLDLRR